MFSEQVDSLRFLQRFLVFSPLTVLSIASWSHHTYQSAPQLYFSDAVSSFWVQCHKIVAKSCWIFKLGNGGLARLPSSTTDDTAETTHFNGLKEISQNYQFRIIGWSVILSVLHLLCFFAFSVFSQLTLGHPPLHPSSPAPTLRFQCPQLPEYFKSVCTPSVFYQFLLHPHLLSSLFYTVLLLNPITSSSHGKFMTADYNIYD